MRGQKRVEDARKRAYDPRIHPIRKKIFTKIDGLHRNSGSPELRSMMRRKSGKPTCGVKPGNDGACDFTPSATTDRARLS
jgi:hypothetical protein